MIYNLKTKTKPLVVHCPGWPQPKIWTPLRDTFLKQKSKEYGCPKDLTIITWHNGNHRQYLSEGLELFGIPHFVLGKHLVNWMNVFKIPLTLERILNLKTKYVMGIDCHDALVLDDPKIILDIFLNLKCEMLFNKEQAGLNSGAWIGSTKFVKSFLSQALKLNFSGNPSDQVLYRSVFEHEKQVLLDHKNQIFQVLQICNQSDFEIIKTL